MPSAVGATDLNQCLVQQNPKDQPELLTERGQCHSGTFQFTWLSLHHGHSGSCQQEWVWPFRSYSVHGRNSRPGEIKGLAFLRSHSSKGQECYTYFYIDRNGSRAKRSSYFPRLTLSKQRKRKCKILVGKRTDGPEIGESQKVEMEEDDNTDHEFQVTKGTSLSSASCGWVLVWQERDLKSPEPTRSDPLRYPRHHNIPVRSILRLPFSR